MTFKSVNMCLPFPGFGNNKYATECRNVPNIEGFQNHPRPSKGSRALPLLPESYGCFWSGLRAAVERDALKAGHVAALSTMAGLQAVAEGIAGSGALGLQAGS